MILVAQGVPGARPLQPDDRDDVAGERLLELLALVGMHLQDPADPLAPVGGRVVDV